MSSDNGSAAAAAVSDYPATLNEAVLQVMREVPYIQKSRSDGLRYTFASEAELIAHLHPAMLKAGLTIKPTGMELLVNEQYQTSRGTSMTHVILRCTYLLSHSASGEKNAIQSLGEASDSGDKAVPKAMTCAMKYALREAYLIETGDDPDRQPSDQGNERVSPFVSKEQAQELSQLMAQAKVPMTTFCRAYQVQKLADLPAEQFEAAKKRLVAKKAAATTETTTETTTK